MKQKYVKIVCISDKPVSYHEFPEKKYRFGDKITVTESVAKSLTSRARMRWVTLEEWKKIKKSKEMSSVKKKKVVHE